MQVNYRAKDFCHLLKISQSLINQIKVDHPKLGRMLLKKKFLLLQQNKSYPLDYDHGVPEMMTPRPYTNQHYTDILNRRNKLKNVVMRRLFEIREEKRKEMDLCNLQLFVKSRP